MTTFFIQLLPQVISKSGFTVVIWGSDHEKFGAAETAYQDRDICVTGQIKEYRNAPEIIAGDTKQITVKGRREERSVPDLRRS